MQLLENRTGLTVDPSRYRGKYAQKALKSFESDLIVNKGKLSCFVPVENRWEFETKHLDND